MKFHIIQPVVVNQNSRSPACASRCRCSILRCSSRIPPWPWTIAFGSPVVPDEYRTHSGWSNGTRSNSSALVGRASAPPSSRRRGSRRVTPGRRPRAAIASSVSRAVELAPVVAVAVDRQQHLRLDLREAVDHAARAEVRRAARPDRAERRARPGTRRSSPGCSACRRRRGRRARRRARAGRRRSARVCVAQLAPRPLGVSSRGSDAWTIAQRVVGLAAEHVLGVVDLRCPGTTARPASRATRAPGRRARRRRRESQIDAPEAVEVARPTSATARRRSSKPRSRM